MLNKGMENHNLFLLEKMSFSQFQVKFVDDILIKPEMNPMWYKK